MLFKKPVYYVPCNTLNSAACDRLVLKAKSNWFDNHKVQERNQNLRTKFNSNKIKDVQRICMKNDQCISSKILKMDTCACLHDF